MHHTQLSNKNKREKSTDKNYIFERNKISHIFKNLINYYY